MGSRDVFWVFFVYNVEAREGAGTWNGDPVICNLTVEREEAGVGHTNSREERQNGGRLGQIWDME